MPFILWLFSTYLFQTFHDKKSGLEIDYDDCYQIMLEHESGAIGSLVIDVITPKVERRIEMWQECFYLEWGGTPDSLKEYDFNRQELKDITVYDSFNQRKEYNHSIIEDAYYEEIVNFMEVVEGKNSPRYTFEADKEVIGLIDYIEGHTNG